MSYHNSQNLPLISLVIAFVCLVVILTCSHFLQKRSKKTLKHINFMLDSEKPASKGKALEKKLNG
jgi:hypothetical protein